MKHLKRLGIAGVVILATCAVAASAEATQITPSNTVVSFDSSNPQFTVHGGFTVACQTSTITGRTPVTSSTWQSIPVTLGYGGACIYSGLGVQLTVSEACHTNGSTPVLHVMGIGSDRAVGTLTLPAACVIQMSIPAINCTMTVRGAQTIGNGTSGFGGLLLTGGAPSAIDLSNTLAPDVEVSNPATSGACPSTGTHSGTFTGNYASATTVHVDGS